MAVTPDTAWQWGFGRFTVTWRIHPTSSREATGPDPIRPAVLWAREDLLMTASKSRPDLPGPQNPAPLTRDLLTIWKEAEDRDPSILTPALQDIVDRLAPRKD